MKIRFYPKKSFVSAIMSKGLEDATVAVQKAEKALEAQKESVLFKPGTEAEDLEEVIKHNRDQLVLFKLKLDAFESHAPPEVMAEMDI